MNTTLIKLGALRAELKYNSVNADSIVFSAQTKDLMAALKLYIPRLMSRYAGLGGDLSSQNSENFLKTLDFNYTDLIKMTPTVMREYDYAIKQYENRIEQDIYSIRDKYNMRTMKSYRYWNGKFNDEQNYQQNSAAPNNNSSNQENQLNLQANRPT